MFRPVETRDVTDKVFINLNNIFYLLTTIYAFVKRFDPDSRLALISGGKVDNTWWIEEFMIYYCIPLTILLFVYFIRLLMMNKITAKMALTYGLLTPLIIDFILIVCGIFVMGLFNTI